jgi:hypothetical protein
MVCPWSVNRWTIPRRQASSEDSLGHRGPSLPPCQGEGRGFESRLPLSKRRLLAGLMRIARLIEFTFSARHCPSLAHHGTRLEGWTQPGVRFVRWGVVHSSCGSTEALIQARESALADAHRAGQPVRCLARAQGVGGGLLRDRALRTNRFEGQATPVPLSMKIICPVRKPACSEVMKTMASAPRPHRRPLPSGDLGLTRSAPGPRPALPDLVRQQDTESNQYEHDHPRTCLLGAPACPTGSPPSGSIMGGARSDSAQSISATAEGDGAV